MSYNEWWYAHVAAGVIEDPFLPPLFVNMGQAIGGELWSLRLVSLVAAAWAVVVVWGVWGERAALTLASLPWFFLWAGRAHTDTLMVAFGLGGLLLARTRTPFWGGFLVSLSAFAKPTGLLFALGLPWRDWRSWAGLGLGAAPFMVWVLTRPGHVWTFHASSSTPFGNTPLNLVGIVLGLGFLWFFARQWRAPAWVIMPGVAFLLFALIKAPVGHEYYLLPAVSLAALGDWGRIPEWGIIANSILGVVLVVLWELPLGG